MPAQSAALSLFNPQTWFNHHRVGQPEYELCLLWSVDGSETGW